VEAAKAIEGSFKLVTPKPVREMTQLPREIQKNGDTQIKKHKWIYKALT